MGVFQDVLVSFVFSVFVYQLYFCYSSLHLKPSVVQRSLSTLGWSSIYFFLFLSAILFASNQEIFLRLHTALSYSLTLSGLKGFTVSSFFSQVTIFQWVYLLSPLCVFALLQHYKKTNASFYFSISMLLLIVMTTVFNWDTFTRQVRLFHFVGNAETYPYRLKSNPYQTVVYGLLATPNNPYIKMNETVTNIQAKSIALLDPAFVSTQERPALLKVSDVKKQWNVVFIILESTAMEYVFDKNYVGRIPMPYLKQLADNGVLFENNFSTGNSSIQGVFSLLSGNYPYFNRGLFEISKDNVVPSLIKGLDSTYAKFMVHPSTQGHYMPSGFVRSSNISLYEKEDLPEKHLPKLEFSWFVNESDGIDFFIDKMKATTGPFFGIYFSGAPHYPYYDYGAKWQIANNIGLEIDRYYNNLFMLDAQLKRVVSALSETGKLDNTIIAIVGDHGEGFGQHPENWKHTTSLHIQQVHVPIVIYQPSLLSPQRVDTLTSSIGLMPTIMNMLDAPFDEKWVQGESWLKAVPKQHYVFMAGSRGQRFSSIDATSKMKLMLNLQTADCRVYDLNVDAGENHPLSCETHNKQLKDLVRFYQYQQKMMLGYNGQLLQKMH